MKYLKTVIYLLFLISCSDTNVSEQEISVTVSDLQSFEIGQLGMSGTIPFIFMPDHENKNNLLVYNQYFRRIDSLFFLSDTVLARKGNEVPAEGPHGIQNFKSFFSNLDYLVYLSGYGVGIDGEEGLEFFGLGSFDFIENDNMTHIVRDNGFNQTYTGLGSKKDIYFLTKNFVNSQYAINHFDLTTKELELIDFPLKDELLQIHDPAFTYNNAEVRAFNFPFLLANEEEIIVSYPFMSTIQVMNIQSRISREFSPLPIGFSSIKEEPIVLSNNASYDQGNEMITKWTEDVHFGPILTYRDQYFYRIVREHAERTNKNYYIEVFDLDFNKILEKELVGIRDVPILKYFSTGDDIILHPINYFEDDEDFYNFYRVNLLAKD
ncbi:DUF4221 domain-containing protein [Algoriphagus halophytocola]|uniref:DUF4221 domain-containing protein n=1 Tax=Algoriphagus halophytocola TaxID=2991499 RepID=A0ABY6MFI2_9BACT|nr:MULTISPECIES: DUF4221 domain-containing protein [unclassified Algoriphagus]UZD22189.1 DUF4221 domain-containing protein [Algoriphagus sp. TR-M5]WBL43440.1 DUF4221 domain-containing protein [Algoriphagus sp. TR-M9]